VEGDAIFTRGAGGGVAVPMLNGSARNVTGSMLHFSA
jgi:hypothetical protein